MNDKWISVVIPVFNAEDYLQECLDSIIHQTIGLEKIEVIIVDDASTDRSLQCIMEYEQQYPEDILVVALKKNNGQADARNIGMEYISAPYFAFLDADDWMEPDGYEKLIRMAIRYQCDIVQCSSISHLGKARPMFQKTVSEPVYYKIDNIEERRRFIRWWNSPGTSGVSIYRTEWIKENNIKFKRFEKYEDNYWGGILSYYINSYCAIPDYLFHYRRHESSNSLSRNDLKHFERLKVELELLKYYHEMELFTDYYQEIRKHFLEVFYINTLHIVICQFDYFPLEIIKEMQEVVKSIFPDFLEYCEDVGEFANPVLTVPFDFPQEIWEDYKRAYLDYLQGKGENKLVQFYTVIRRSLGM